MVASVILWVPKLLGLSEILIGLPPLVFMAYVIHKSHKARRARRAEEAREILDADHEIAERIALVGHHLGAIRSGTLDVDHRRLSDARGRV